MAQLPFSGPDSLDVHLPATFERWRDVYLHGFLEKLVVFLILALLLYAVVRLARGQIREQIEDVNRRHTLAKWVGYGYALVLVAIGLALFSGALTGLGTVLALILAGIAVALQDVLKSVVGWLYISSRSGVQVGSRVEVDGVRGDVIDIGVLKSTLLEVGNLVYADQSTGRLVTVPNSKMLAATVFISAAENLFSWQEIKLTLTFESDWRRAEQILQEAGDAVHVQVAPQLESGLRAMERRYAFKYGALTPIVYMSIADSGIDLTLRFQTHVRRRRGSVDFVSRRIMDALNADPAVELAYPTYRLVRAGKDGMNAR